MEWLHETSPDIEWVRFHGWTGKYLYEEARYCFAYGQFIASILLALAFVERALAGDFYAAGRDDLERASLNRLLTEARAVGWVSAESRRKIDELRDKRNRLTHFRRPGDKGSLERRAIALETDVYEIVEQDAQSAIELMDEILAAS